MPNFFVSLFRTTTLSATLARQLCDWDKCTEIIPGLFLGSLPITKAPCGRNKRFTNDLRQISEFVLSKDPERPLKHIVSTVEPDELEGKGFAGVETISQEDLEELQIERDILEICDYDKQAKCDLQKAADLLKKMHEIRRQKKSVYVHCKAGCQRSAMTTACYLAAFIINPITQKKYTVEEAFELIKSQRKQISVTEGRLIQAKRIVAFLNKEKFIEPAQTTRLNQLSHFWQRNKTTILTTAITAGVAITAMYRQ